MSSKIQNKLLHYETDPPKEVWNKIAALLDNRTSLTFSEKLYQFEEEPKADVWNKIEAQLEEDHSAVKVIPIHTPSRRIYTRFGRPLKYGSAVALLIFIAVSTTILISKRYRSEQTGPNTSSKVLPKLESIIPIENNTSNEVNSTSDIVSVKNISSKPIDRSKRSGFSIMPIQLLATSSFLNSFLPSNAQRQEDVDYHSPDDKYMVYSDADGNATRLPKKLFDVFACPQDDDRCRQRLRNLQQKIASSAFASDFTGVLDMLNNLQDNK